MSADLQVLEGAETRLPPLSILAQGLPIGRTLEAVAKVAANLQAGARCAITLPREDGFVLAAESGLLEGDLLILADLCKAPHRGTAGSLRQQKVEVRKLLTQTAELVGLIAVFGFESSNASGRVVQQLDEISAIATSALEQNNLTEELSYRANHDPLTHLWNRSWMEVKIGKTLQAAAGTGGLTGIILLGVDGFRLFNELLGREAGDNLLRQLAERVNEALDPGWFLARSGSDEFTILMPELPSAARADAFASHLRARFDQPFLLGDHELIVRASFGIATAKPGECLPNDLQNRADQALLFAKRGLRGRVAAFSAEIMKTPTERLVMERHLRFALQKREFEIYYQPQLNLLTGGLIGVEALLRWKHPSLGFISPATFVPLAEEIGIIEEIGEWVLAEAIYNLEHWQHSDLAGIRLAVNVSACQFARTDFASMVSKRLRSASIIPQHLELEVTETTLMTDLQHGASQLKLLRALGVQTALDDFGTGHSSLAYLQKLPVDRLKIDRMFVKDIVRSDERPALLSSIIQLGRSIGCKVIAEGVETAEQALALSRMECEEAQGFLFSKPLCLADLLKWTVSRRVSANF